MQGELGSIPGRGTGYHMPQQKTLHVTTEDPTHHNWRRHPSQLKAPHATAEDPTRHSWRPHTPQLKTPHTTAEDPTRHSWRPHTPQLKTSHATAEDPTCCNEDWRSHVPNLAQPNKQINIWAGGGGTTISSDKSYQQRDTKRARRDFRSRKAL